jgi:hypothetical protein
VASEDIPDEPGSVVAGSETQQISTGTLSWETCTPLSEWLRTVAWNPGVLDPSGAIPYNHQDWLLDGDIRIRWHNGATLVRREDRVLLWRNGTVVSDDTEIDLAPGDLVDSAVDAIALTRSTYTFTPVLSGWTFTPPTSTHQRPDSLEMTFRQEWFDQTSLTYTNVNIYAAFALSNVYKGTRTFSGLGFDVAVNSGDVGTVVWNIWRSHDADPYGLAWEDCSPPPDPDPEPAANCVYTEDAATSCTLTEDAEATGTLAEDPATSCTHAEDAEASGTLAEDAATTCTYAEDI